MKEDKEVKEELNNQVKLRNEELEVKTEKKITEKPNENETTKDLLKKFELKEDEPKIEKSK